MRALLRDRDDYCKRGYSTFTPEGRSIDRRDDENDKMEKRNAVDSFESPTPKWRELSTIVRPCVQQLRKSGICGNVTWGVFCAVLFFGMIILQWYYQSTSGSHYATKPFHEMLRWHWDHNLYKPSISKTLSIPRNCSVSDLQSIPDVAISSLELHSPDNINTISEEFVEHRCLPSNLLILQVASNEKLDELTKISGRCNRAYARSRGWDYLRVSSDGFANSQRTRKVQSSCFDKVFVVDNLMKTFYRSFEGDELGFGAIYTGILLLPPDAIILDLDSDLLLLYDSKAVVSIAGWDPRTQLLTGNVSGAVLFNLRHRYILEVIEKWAGSVGDGQTSCADHNDIQMLVDAVYRVPLGREGVIEIGTLFPNPKGPTSVNGMMKVLPQSPIPVSRNEYLVSNFNSARMELEMTSASVCYRYYPQCDVL